MGKKLEKTVYRQVTPKKSFKEIYNNPDLVDLEIKKLNDINNGILFIIFLIASIFYYLIFFGIKFFIELIF